MERDFSVLPTYAQTPLKTYERCLDDIWIGWTNDIYKPTRGKLRDFVKSTAGTMERLGYNLAPKTISMLTSYALRYYLLPGNSDLEKHGSRYGWESPKNA